MKNTKKLLSIFSICFLILLYLSCTKDLKSDKPLSSTTTQDLSIITAKTFFDRDVAPTAKAITTTTNSTTSKDFNQIKDFLKNLDWAKAYNTTIDNLSVVVIPIRFPSQYYIHVSNTDSGARFDINHLSNLIVYSNAQNILQAEVVTSFPDQNFLENLKGPFSGTILVQNWAGDIIKGLKFENGKIWARTPDTLVSNSGNAPNYNIPVAPAPTITYCNFTDYYTCVGGGNIDWTCSFSFTQNNGCYTVPAEGGTSGTFNNYSYALVGHGSGGSGGSGGTNTVVRSDYTFTVNPAHSHLCGTNYNWGSLSSGVDAWYTTFDGYLNFDIVGTGVNWGDNFNITMDGATFMFAKTNVFTTAQATLAMQVCWNYAIQKVIDEVSANWKFGTDNVRTRMKYYIQAKMNSQYPGATFNYNPGTGIPTSYPTWCP